MNLSRNKNRIIQGETMKNTKPALLGDELRKITSETLTEKVFNSVVEFLTQELKEVATRGVDTWIKHVLYFSIGEKRTSSLEIKNLQSEFIGKIMNKFQKEDMSVRYDDSDGTLVFSWYKFGS
jgi:hypothetical protein